MLLLVSVKLSEKEPEPELMAVEYTVEIPEEELAINNTEKVKIETNTAYNEAEEFIKELENSRNNEEEVPQETSNETDAGEKAAYNSDYALNDVKDQLQSVKERLAENAKKNKKKTPSSATNKKTTISYRLVDRKALTIRNPVYTCDAGGKIVINIEVDQLGRVIKTSFNKASSTTTNGCLIDSAMLYASKAKFTTKAGKTKQMGTISYTFPGQR